MPEMCKVGGGLYAYWCQIAQLLEASGLTRQAVMESPAYNEAFEQYRQHRTTCPYCLERIQETLAWGMTARPGGNFDEMEIP